MGSSAETFFDLTDTPGTYAGQASRAVVVNAGATGLGFGVPATPILTHTDSTLAPVLAQAGHWFHCTNACTITLPSDATAALPIGTSLTFSQASTGALTFAAGSGATVNVAPTHPGGMPDQTVDVPEATITVSAGHQFRVFCGPSGTFGLVSYGNDLNRTFLRFEWGA